MIGFGHASSMEQPIVTTRLASRINSVVRVLGLLEEMSIPRSRNTSTTVGLIRVEGFLRALCAFIPCCLAKPSAIWLRPALSTQTNSTGPLQKLGSLHGSPQQSANQTSGQWSYPGNVDTPQIP